MDGNTSGKTELMEFKSPTALLGMYNRSIL